MILTLTFFSPSWISFENYLYIKIILDETIIGYMFWSWFNFIAGIDDRTRDLNCAEFNNINCTVIAFLHPPWNIQSRSQSASICRQGIRLVPNWDRKHATKFRFTWNSSYPRISFQAFPDSELSLHFKDIESFRANLPLSQSIKRLLWRFSILRSNIWRDEN